jgi:hypothetical protein
VAAGKRSATRKPGSLDSSGTRADAKSGTSRSASDVSAFLRELDHPLKREIESVRRTVLGVSREISEGIKWNSLSFRTTDYFATVNLRCRDSVQLIFHRGAKVKDNSTKAMKISDPAGLIRWLAAERCLVTLGAGKKFQANRSAFETIVGQWIGQR